MLSYQFSCECADDGIARSAILLQKQEHPHCITDALLILHPMLSVTLPLGNSVLTNLGNRIGCCKTSMGSISGSRHPVVSHLMHCNRNWPTKIIYHSRCTYVPRPSGTVTPVRFHPSFVVWQAISIRTTDTTPKAQRAFITAANVNWNNSATDVFDNMAYVTG